MGYEIAGGLGVKMALPDREVIVMVGDGSYLMLNSEIATSVMLGLKLTIVLLDNGGYGCINRLQQATAAARRSTTCWSTPATSPCRPSTSWPMPAASAPRPQKVASIAELEAAFASRARPATTQVILIDTDAGPSTEAGGFWWDVAVPEVSVRPEVQEAHKDYETKRSRQRTAG